jgi:adenosylcobinamide kinase / adenosylcobinamide-phosphate guanylyltransferase
VPGVVLLLGGARSGKSTWAVRLGERHAAAGGNVVFVATAEPFDDDMRTRIERHRVERPQWPTVEAPVELAAAVSACKPSAMVIVDCLTTWWANLFAHDLDASARSAHADALLSALAARVATTVVVSNELGLGLVPDTELGRVYRDELGRLNQRVAATAERSLLLVAGRALRLDDPEELLT